MSDHLTDIPPLPREHPARYEARALYLRMGADRNLRGLAQQLGKSSTLMGQWSSQDDWQAHARAYDAAVQTVIGRHALAQRITEWEAYRTRGNAIGRALETKGAQGLAALNASTLKATEVAALLTLARDMQAEALQIQDALAVLGTHPEAA